MSADKQTNLLSFDEVLALILDEICTYDGKTICDFVNMETDQHCTYLDDGYFVIESDNEMHDLDELKAFLTEQIKGNEGENLLTISQEWTSLQLTYQGDSLFERITDGFVVKWEDCWLAPFGFSNSSESRSFDRKCAEVFATEDLAQARIEQIRTFRKCNNVQILPA